jgi:hypothetical protein
MFMATRTQDDQPSSNDQSGSTGRRTEKKDLGREKDTGQDRYGQTGLGGKVHRETIGQKDYKNSGTRTPDDTDSNRGSGTDEDESERGKEKRKP